MSKRVTRRKRQSGRINLPSGISTFIDRLVELGCDRKLISRRIEDFCQLYETSKKQQRKRMEIKRGPAETAVDDIRKAGLAIHSLQEDDYWGPNPMAPLTLRAFLGELTPAEKRAITVYEAFPSLLEQYASAVEPQIDFMAAMSSRDIAKWRLIQYVEASTGSPQYDLLSFLLSARVEELGLKRPIAGREDLSADALRKFYRQHKKDLPKAAGRKILDFLRFLVRLTD